MNPNKRQRLQSLVFTINGEAKDDEVENFFVDNVCFHIKKLYKPMRLIGKGNYGATVCSAENNEDNGRMVSVKKIPISSINRQKQRFETLQVYREMFILSHLNSGEYRHPCIVRLLDIMIPVIQGRDEMDFEEIYLVYGYMDDDLDKLIKTNQLKSVRIIKNYFTQMLKGVEYMHSLSIMHRDLKPKNVLVDHMHHGLQICDFGWSSVFKQTNAEMLFNVGTKYYRAPELVLGCGKHNTAVDIWSLGCVFGEVLLGKPIFDNGEEDEDELEAIISFVGPPSEDDMDFIDNNEKKDFLKNLLADQKFSSLNIVPFAERFPNVAERFPDVDDSVFLLVQRMLSFNPTKRITANECLKTDFIAATAERWDQVYSTNQAFNPQFAIPIAWEDNASDPPTVRSLMWTTMKNVHKENPGVYDDLLQNSSMAFGLQDE